MANNLALSIAFRHERPLTVRERQALAPPRRCVACGYCKRPSVDEVTADGTSSCRLAQESANHLTLEWHLTHFSF